MTTRARPITAEELLKRSDDDLRHELVRGELREMTPAGSKHGYLALEIGAELRNHVKANNLGRTYTAETGFKIASDPDTVRAPDAAFVSQDRLDRVGEVEGYWPGAPDMAVEVVSPNDVYTDAVEKSLSWLEAGCRMVLVVDPAQRTVTVYRSLENIRIPQAEAGDIFDGGDVVLGWRLDLAGLFA